MFKLPTQYKLGVLQRFILTNEYSAL